VEPFKMGYQGEP